MQPKDQPRSDRNRDTNRRQANKPTLDFHPTDRTDGYPWVDLRGQPGGGRNETKKHGLLQRSGLRLRVPGKTLDEQGVSAGETILPALAGDDAEFARLGIEVRLVVDYSEPGPQR
jgi:hypothetical protein